MKESYVSYEIAKRLKECGFDWETRNFIYKWEDGKTFEGEKNEPTDHNSLTAPDVKVYSQPSLSMAQKWLREVKGIMVDPFASIPDRNWAYRLYNTQGDKFGRTITIDGNNFAIYEFNSYESALSAGIAKALKLLTEKK